MTSTTDTTPVQLDQTDVREKLRILLRSHVDSVVAMQDLVSESTQIRSDSLRRLLSAIAPVIAPLIAPVLLAVTAGVSASATQAETSAKIDLTTTRQCAILHVEDESAPTSGAIFSSRSTMTATRNDFARAASRASVSKAMLEPIYRYEAEGAVRKAMVAVFKTVDDCMSADNFNACDSMLQSIDLAKLSPDTIVAVLSSTFPGREKLPSRPSLYSSAMTRLEAALGVDRAHAVADRMR